jgi:hypothetical protein
LTGLLAQFKSDGPAGFPLSDRCAIRSVSAGSNILDPHGDDITAAKLAVDRQIEHCEVANAAIDLEFRPIDLTYLGRSGGFAPVSFPLFHGTRLGAGAAFTCSCMAILLGSVSEGEEHALLRVALESRRFSSRSGLRVRPSSKRPVAFDPRRTSPDGGPTLGALTIFMAREHPFLGATQRSPERSLRCERR